jgi:hypothetical protein
MGATTRTIDDLDSDVWEAMEAFARSHGTSLGTLVSEALARYLEEEQADLETAATARAEGGRIPYDLGWRLLFADSDDEADRIQAEIDAHDLVSRR